MENAEMQRLLKMESTKISIDVTRRKKGLENHAKGTMRNTGGRKWNME